MENNVVLGIFTCHDAGVAIIKNNQILFAINEERLNRVKFYWGFPDLSIRKAGVGAKVEFKILEYVFNTLKLNKLRCEVLVTNQNVIKMHEKFGFRRESYYREHCIKNNEKIDAIGLGILKSEWVLISETMKSKIYGK